MSDRFNALNPNDDPPYYNPEYGLSEGAQTCASVLPFSPCFEPRR